MNNIINNNFLFFKTQEAFERERKNISPTSIVFIKDSQTIYTHNTYFGLSTSIERSKGYFETLEELQNSVKTPQVGDWAIVNDDGTWYIASYKAENGWVLTTQKYSGDTYNLSDYIKRDEFEPTEYVRERDLTSRLSNYLTSGDIQNLPYATQGQLINLLEQIQTLSGNKVSAEDFKTINGTSVYGSGNIDVVTPNNINNYIEIPTPQEPITVDVELSESSINPVQNAAIASEINKKANTVDVEASLNTKAAASELASCQQQLNAKANSEDIVDLRNQIDNKVDRSILNQYAKKDEIESTVENYVTENYITEVTENVVNEYITQITQEVEKAKGYYDSFSELEVAVPNPEVGDWAVVNSNGIWVICRCTIDGEWIQTAQEWKHEEIDLTQYAKKTDLNDYLKIEDYHQSDNVDLSPYAKTVEVNTALNQKQDVLISSSNIKTINGESLLGSENIQITTDYEYVDNKFDAVRILATTNNQSFLSRLNELENVLLAIQKEYISWKDDEDTPAGARPERSSYGGKFITLTVAEYNALVQQGLVQEDTYYFTYEGSTEPTTWHFGDGFPIIFSSNDNLGVFPITLI